MTPTEQAIERIVAMESERDPCYILGRLIAVTERIIATANSIQAAQKATEDAIAQGPVMPHRCYVRLAKLAHDRIHQLRINDRRRRSLDRLLTQLAAEVGSELPKRMSSEQSALMMSGYHHQRAALFATEVEMTREEHDAAMEAAKRGAAQLVAVGFSEVEAAARLGISRLTVRSALGKR